jgi:hypothetical protein
MAVAPEQQTGEEGGRPGRPGKPKWLCAEHSGEISAFSNLDLRFEDLGDWNGLFKRETRDVPKLLKGTLVTLSVGGLGLLGAASTGTSIQSLSGAALTKASLAYLGRGSLAAGGGGMVLGTGVIGAAGAALGTAHGATIANAYFGELKKRYKIKVVRRVRRDERRSQPPLLFVNGFLRGEDGNFGDWERETRTLFSESAAYGVEWPSGRSKRAALKRLSKDGPAANPWLVALVKANQVGILNAEMLSRFDGPPPILMGHSLGARTIYMTLRQLAERGGPPKVQDVFLFGGAVERDAEWRKAARAVSGRIWNFYSAEDQVLKHLYPIGRPSLARLVALCHKVLVLKTLGPIGRPSDSGAIGAGRIKGHGPKVVNINCRGDVGGVLGHTYKDRLERLLLKRAAPRACWPLGWAVRLLPQRAKRWLFRRALKLKSGVVSAAAR